MFVVVIITSSIHFVGIVHKCIVLHYLLVVLRLLGVLKDILTGKKSGYFSFLSDNLVTYATYKHMLKHYTALPVTSADCGNNIVLLKY